MFAADPGGMKPLIAIVGNTGVGKSQFAVELAKKLNGEIINGDAMQMYQGLDIITNKHPEPERQGIAHHLLGTQRWSDQVTVQNFESQATRVVDQIHSKNKVPILVGGTHYYVQSLIAENALISMQHEQAVKEKRFTPEQITILNDPSKVETQLRQVDPLIAAKFHPNDTRRLRRALEIWYETGEKPSSIYNSQRSGAEESRLKFRYKVLVFWVWCQRETLVSRLDSRVDKMLKQGLLKELDELYENYEASKNTAGIWQVLGFKQFLNYLDNPNQENLKKGIEAMKVDTRHYAKKQTKWIRNKLCPLIAELNGDLALVDSTDLEQWDVNVRQRGIEIAKAWLAGKDSKDFVPNHLKNEVIRKRQAYDPTQWKRHRCDACSDEEKETILMGDDELQVHLQSKSHLFNVRKASLKN